MHITVAPRPTVEQAEASERRELQNVLKVACEFVYIRAYLRAYGYVRVF